MFVTASSYGIILCTSAGFGAQDIGLQSNFRGPSGQQGPYGGSGTMHHTMQGRLALCNLYSETVVQFGAGEVLLLTTTQFLLCAQAHVVVRQCTQSCFMAK